MVIPGETSPHFSLHHVTLPPVSAPPGGSVTLRLSPSATLLPAPALGQRRAHPGCGAEVTAADPLYRPALCEAEQRHCRLQGDTDAPGKRFTPAPAPSPSNTPQTSCHNDLRRSAQTDSAATGLQLPTLAPPRAQPRCRDPGAIPGGVPLRPGGRVQIRANAQQTHTVQTRVSLVSVTFTSRQSSSRGTN